MLLKKRKKGKKEAYIILLSRRNFITLQRTYGMGNPERIYLDASRCSAGVGEEQVQIGFHANWIQQYIKRADISKERIKSNCCDLHPLLHFRL